MPFFLLAMATTSMALADPVDDYIANLMKSQQVPGVVLEIAKDGKVVKKKAYGMADLELDVPMKEDDFFEIGSITKQFTAVCICQLMEQGKVSLTDPISKFIDGTPDTWKNIQIHNLLNQNSGLKDYALVPHVGLLDEYDMPTWLSTMKPLPLDFETGSTWAYSNTNYVLLGMVIEKASGQKYTDYLNANVLKPAGLTHTSILNPDAILPNRAHGYYKDGATLIRGRPSMVSTISDGALISTADDMTQWEAALHCGKLLKPESYKLMTSAGPLNNGRTRQYGYGTFLEALGEKPFFGHPGASSGYSAGSGYFPTDKLSVVILTNVYAINGLKAVKDIGVLVDPSLKPDPVAALPDPDSARTQRIKSALDKLGVGASDADLLEPDINSIMGQDRIKTFGNPYGVLAGIKKIEFAGDRPAPYPADAAHTENSKARWLTYKVTTDKAVLDVNAIYTVSNKIAMVYVRADGS
jgi:CubicO group peptidase (beta-lactamase class C family)